MYWPEDLGFSEWLSNEYLNTFWYDNATPSECAAFMIEKSPASIIDFAIQNLKRMTDDYSRYFDEASPL